MRIVSPKRGAKAAKRLDTTDLRGLLKDRRLWAQLAVVAVPEGASKQWELIEGDLLVDVETVPQGLELRCRLGAAAGAIGMGLWRVPAVGTEVAVLVPDGDLGFSPLIVACLSSGGAPDRASDTRTVLVATDVIEITAPKVVIGPEPALMLDPMMGALNGEAVDPFTGMQHWALGNASRVVLVKK